jgi:serine/threonine-protein kinase
MNQRIYFDIEELKKGEFYELHSRLLITEEQKSYELGDWIGRGGNATVFQCREHSTGEECAVKFLMHHGLKSKQRFSREVSLMKKVKGAHMITYQGSGKIRVKHNKKGLRRKVIPFIIMELADQNLQDLIRDNIRPLSYEQYANQFRGLAESLARLHHHAVHRDIKPENILITGDRWLLSDYGLCTFIDPDAPDLTQGAQKIGPNFWLSPEAQNRRLGCGDQINAASDVFQLAAIFWYVATGRHPSGIVTENDWTGPEKLFDVLHKSLFHDYNKRPQNGSEFFEVVADALSQ